MGRAGGDDDDYRGESSPSLREYFRRPAQGENIHKAVSEDLGKFLTARGLLDKYLDPLHEEHDEIFGPHLVAMYKGSGIQGDFKQHKETKTSLVDLMGGSLEAAKETEPEYVMHGTWMYALPCICATGGVPQSDTEERGHEFQKAPVAYATCCRDVVIQYARPFRPNNGWNDTWQIVLVLRVVKKHSAWVKGRKGIYVYGPNSLRLSRVLFIPNRPDLWRNSISVVMTYHPLLEASPSRLSRRLENTGEGASSDADDVPLRRDRKSSAWTGWCDNPPLGRQDIIDANDTQGAQNLWWVIEESMESIPGGPTFSIENIGHNVHLGGDNGEEVRAYKKTAGEHPPLNQQWIFVPANNLDAFVQELDAAVDDDAPL